MEESWRIAEEALLEKQLDKLDELMTETGRLEGEMHRLEESVEAIRIENVKEQFLLEAQQVKMLGELQKIFPIQMISDDVWKIRDLSIHRDYSIVDDEKLSAALSYVAHLVFMMAKFLDVPLRYKILANGSRQDVNVFYTLFKTRVDRERFEKACWLLERDVDCLCSVRGIVIESQVNGRQDTWNATYLPYLPPTSTTQGDVFSHSYSHSHSPILTYTAEKETASFTS